jgi:hypothetical protein
MSGLEPIAAHFMAEEIRKIAEASLSVSAPSIKAPPSPAGDGTSLKPKPASPVTPKAITSKALKSTNLQKTNYTNVGTKVPSLDTSQSWSRGIQPPVVRS